MSITINSKINQCVELINEKLKPVDEVLKSGKLNDKDKEHLEKQIELIGSIIEKIYDNPKFFDKFVQGVLPIFIKAWTQTDTSKYPYFTFDGKKKRFVFKYSVANPIEQMVLGYFNDRNCFMYSTKKSKKQEPKKEEPKKETRQEPKKEEKPRRYRQQKQN